MRTVELEKALDRIGRTIVAKGKGKLQEKGLKSTGQLDSSLKYRVVTGTKYPKLVVTGKSYGEVLNVGLSGLEVKRSTPYEVGRNIFIQRRDILSWVRRKGISFGTLPDKRVAGIITKSLRRKGYPAKPWLRETITESHATITRTLADALGKDLAKTLSFSIKTT